MNIIIIGTGKVANILAAKLFAENHKIIGIMGRNRHAAEQLAISNDAVVIENYSLVEDQIDFIIITVSDAAINLVAPKTQSNSTIIVHTAGGINKQILANFSANYGVFYPLQSITTHSSPEIHFPIIVEGNNEYTTNKLLQLAKSISNNVVEGNDNFRMKMHLSAVVVNNFTNYLFALAKDFCDTEQLDFKLLMPLMTETIDRLKILSPTDVFTGPAIRNDTITIENHLDLLNKHPTLQKTYKLFTEDLQSYFKTFSKDNIQA